MTEPLACVVVAYKLPAPVVNAFFKNNEVLAAMASIYLVTDNKTPFHVEHVPCPEMNPFAICRAANLGIRRAINDGADVVLKTDIDCIWTIDAIGDLMKIKRGAGICWRYWHIPDAMHLHYAKMDSRCVGSAALAAFDWLRLCGYDERMNGYGHDDGNLLRRARSAGIKLPVKAKPRLYHVRHSKHNRSTINPFRRQENRAIGMDVWNNPAWGL